MTQFKIHMFRRQTLSILADIKTLENRTTKYMVSGMVLILFGVLSVQIINPKLLHAYPFVPILIIGMALSIGVWLFLQNRKLHNLEKAYARYYIEQWMAGSEATRRNTKVQEDNSVR